MPRLTVAQRTWVCNESARVGNAHKAQRKWRNCWKNMNKKKIPINKNTCFL